MLSGWIDTLHCPGRDHGTNLALRFAGKASQAEAASSVKRKRLLREINRILLIQSNDQCPQRVAVIKVRLQGWAELNVCHWERTGLKRVPIGDE